MKDALYFQRYAYTQQLIYEPVPHNLNNVVVLPCFKEPDVMQAVIALANCTPPTHETELIVVVNSGSHNFHQYQKENNQSTLALRTWWQHKPSFFKTHIINAPLLPSKDAGVGLARKIGMDEAARRLYKAGNKKGIITCFDADSTCQPNFFTALENLFNDKNTNGCSIHFEHPYINEQGEINENIVDYEIHLRYYKNMLAFCHFPYPYHTIGSSMAITAEAYTKQGGMNKRKAGEDFYFLHKIFLLGKFKELTNTTIFPSGRISDRVPFGTGRAMKEAIENTKNIDSYTPKAFELLKSFYNHLTFLPQEDFNTWFKNLPKEIQHFLQTQNLHVGFEKINNKKAPKNVAFQQLIQIFDGFTVLKFCHFYRDHYKKNVSVMEAGNYVLNLHQLPTTTDKITLLQQLRHLDKKQNC